VLCPVGAGSFTEPNDGGWNKTSGMVSTKFTISAACCKASPIPLILCVHHTTRVGICFSQVRDNKPYMKYSNVRMSDGASFTGNMVATATAHTLKVHTQF
jgi:hypothetical protein